MASHSNGKGSTRRPTDERKFCQNHTKSYGETRMVSGRRTIIKVQDGKLVKIQKTR